MVSQSAVSMHESPSNKWSNCPLKMCAILGLARAAAPSKCCTLARYSVGCAQLGWGRLAQLCAAKVRQGKVGLAVGCRHVVV